jgi:GT2 family glycosyltransferase
MDSPAVSVIIPAWCSDETLPACLHSLREQTFRDFEVIVVDSSPNGKTTTLVGSDFPEVRFQHSAKRLWPHMARNAGASLARGQILVFSDPDCRMSKAWLDALVRAHRRGHTVVGGPVSNLRHTWFLDGVHLCKYAWWLPGAAAGIRPELPSANVSYSSALFARIGPFPDEWCGDTLLAQRAREAGVTLWLEPSAIVDHDHRVTWLPFLRERFQRGYDFGLVRPRIRRWNGWRILAYVAATPLTVLLMIGRCARYAWLASNLGSLLRCLPVVVAGYTARQLGESFAYMKALWLRS